MKRKSTATRPTQNKICGILGCTATHKGEPCTRKRGESGIWDTKYNHVLEGVAFREDAEGDWHGLDGMLCPHRIDNGTTGILIVSGGQRVAAYATFLRAAKAMKKYEKFMATL